MTTMDIPRIIYEAEPSNTGVTLEHIRRESMLNKSNILIILEPLIKNKKILLINNKYVLSPELFTIFATKEKERFKYVISGYEFKKKLILNILPSMSVGTDYCV